ncbi:hypothetical protein GCM10010412_081030 [Nonomuraea recticatena]|uniref:Uncharacterized protein n=1 Tax=Nonomuraea recticatena TaxID=46178 RepID=A0ABN3T233_9ACTN
MAEPEGEHGGVDAGLEQGLGAGMAQDMRVQPLPATGSATQRLRRGSPRAVTADALAARDQAWPAQASAAVAAAETRLQLTREDLQRPRPCRLGQHEVLKPSG